MKNKIIMVLLLAAVGFGQDAQAMAGMVGKCRQIFARKKEVIRDAVVRVAINTLIATCLRETLSYYAEKKLYEIIERESPAPLLSETEEEIQVWFRKHGLYPEINNTVNATAVQELPDGKTQLAISELDRCVLEHGRLDVCRGMSTVTLEKKHVMAVLSGHEVDHLLYHDSVKKRIRHEAMEEELKKNPDDEELAKALKLAFLKENREIEERADRNAAYNFAGRDADPEILAQHTEHLAHYLSFLIPLEQKYLASKKPIADRHKVEPEELIDHPLASVRVAYLKELAAEFRAKKALQMQQEALKKQQEESISFKVATFAKQQREELGKLFRGELEKKVHKNYGELS